MGTDSVRRGLARIAIALVVGLAAFVYYTVLTLPPPQEEVVCYVTWEGHRECIERVITP